jgi:hypothetical protein
MVGDFSHHKIKIYYIILLNMVYNNIICTEKLGLKKLKNYRKNHKNRRYS